MMPKAANHWSELAKTIIREIRGERSPEEINLALGLNFNQVHRWESGRKRILWSEFAQLCESCNIPLKEACEKIFRFYDPIGKGELFLQMLIDHEDIETFAKQYNVGIQIVRRWRSGESELTFEGALKALEFRAHSVVPLISNLIDLSKIPVLMEAHLYEKTRLDLFYSHPATAMLITTLHLAEVRNAPHHDIALFQKYMNIDASYLQFIIDLSLERGLLEKRDGRFYTPNLALSLRSNPERILDFYRYWTERAVRTQCDMKEESTESFFPTFIVTTNAESRRKIAEAIVHLRTTIANAVRSDDPIDRMSVIQISCFTPTELPSPH